jgi:methionyl-tRNA formyltransferase
MNIACITYRDWAVDIYEKIYSIYNDRHNFLIWRDKSEYDEKKLIEFNPDIILWYGWSWIVKDIFVNNYVSIMLHPSPLPKYRGGSPIQNQIINGEKLGAVTLFRMNEGLDKGDIFQQLPMSLEGTLDEIFDRISSLGFASTCAIIDGNYNLEIQDDAMATYFKRRTIEDSEVTLNELKEMPGEYLYNKIRMLADPYPNAYFKTIDGRKLIFKNVQLL